MASSHPLRFYHPTVGDHVINVGMDEIIWGYSLNTANYPTYGGEVVQILSCFIDNVDISGTFRTYREMENFYAYFLGYLKLATQGNGSRQPGQTSFNQQPMIFQYPHRGWEFKIIPLEIPGFRYATDVVAPVWKLLAHVLDPTDDLKDDIVREIEIASAIGDSNTNIHFGLQGKIGLVEPAFSDPFTDKQGEFSPLDSKAVQQAGEYYSKIIPAYLSGDYETILGGVGSKPSFGSEPTPKKGRGTDDPTQTQQSSKKK